MTTSGHTIRVLTRAELDKQRFHHQLCQVSAKCAGKPAYQADWVSSRGHKMRARYCVSHASQYAQRQNLDLPPLPQQPKDHTAPLPASVVARGGATFAAHGLPTNSREPEGGES